MGRGWQAQIDQRQLRRARGVAQQGAGSRAGRGADDFKFVGQHEGQCIHDQLVVIDQQQQRALW